MSEDSTPRNITDVLNGVLERLGGSVEADQYFRRFQKLRDRTVWTAPEDHRRYWVAGQAIIDEMVADVGPAVKWAHAAGQFWAGRES